MYKGRSGLTGTFISAKEMANRISRELHQLFKVFPLGILAPLPFWKLQDSFDIEKTGLHDSSRMNMFVQFICH